MKCATVSPVPYLAYLYHQINEVLHAEYPVVGNRILLIDGFHKKPEVVDNFYYLRVYPEIAASHHRVEELFLLI